jgi:hypothetical protein
MLPVPMKKLGGAFVLTLVLSFSGLGGLGLDVVAVIHYEIPEIQR